MIMVMMLLDARIWLCGFAVSAIVTCFIETSRQTRFTLDKKNLCNESIKALLRYTNSFYLKNLCDEVML